VTEHVSPSSASKRDEHAVVELDAIHADAFFPSVNLVVRADR